MPMIQGTLPRSSEQGMNRMLPTTFRVFLFVVLASVACLATAQTANVYELNRQARTAYENKDYSSYVRVLEQMYELRPQNGDVMYKLAGAYALNNASQQAFDMLLRMVVMGLAYDVSSDADFSNLHDYQVYDYVAESLKSNFQPFGASEVAFVVDEKGLLGEGVAYDEKTGNFFISSVRKGKVIRIDKDGRAKDFIKPGQDGLWGAFGIKTDSERRHLWVASSAAPQFKNVKKADIGRAGLFKFDLDTGKLVDKYIIAPDGQPHLLGELVIASNGDVYASDSQTPMVFKLAHDSERVESLFKSDNLVNLQGIALGPREKYLFVADYQLGLFVADLEVQRIHKLAVPRDVNVGGIDGLYFHGEDQLIAIQNGIHPNRVVRFWVNDAFTGIVGTEPIESANSHFDDPTLGTFVNGDFYYVANSQWPLYGADGRVSDPDQLRALVVLKTPVAADAKPVGERIVPIPSNPNLMGPAGAPRGLAPDAGSEAQDAAKDEPDS